VQAVTGQQKTSWPYGTGGSGKRDRALAVR